MNKPNLWISGSVVGLLAGVCYMIAILVPMPDTQLGTTAELLVACAWPLFAIPACYAFHDFIATERPSAANHLFFVFAVVAFTTLVGMICVQLSVVAGLRETTQGLDAAMATILKRSLRLVDWGLDVAWDMLFGTALIFWGTAMWRRTGFGIGWALPAIGLGAAMIVFNAATFPRPPAADGLFDVGPFIGVYLMLLGTRLFVLGRRAARAVLATEPTAPLTTVLKS